MKKYLWEVLLLTISLKFVIINCQLDKSSESLSSSSKGKYGDRCLKSSSCDPEAKLSCIGESCKCARDFEIYDYVRELCATKEGERCNPPKFDFGEYNPCVSNAFCSENSRICVCAAHSYPDGQRRCIRKKFYNDTCTHSRECDDLKYLSCVDDRCACKLSSYDEYYQICRRRVGDGCLRSRDCVEHSDCIESKCTCRENFIETSGKTCGLSYGQNCGADEDDTPTCSDVYYACVNGVCRCKNPSYEQFDNSTQSCLSLVGGLCHLFLSSKNRQPLRLKNCIKNSICVRRELSPLSQCECAKGFIETVSGYCKLPYGSICKVPGEKDALECVEPLDCRNGRCECQNENDVYDSEEKVCRRIVGSICTKDTECVSNAQCDSARCRCVSGALPTFRGGCEIEPQQSSGQEHFFNIIPAPNSIYPDFNNYYFN